MLTTLVSALLCTAPATGLTLSAELGKVGTPASTYLDAIEQELLASGLPVRRLKLTCAGDRECLLRGAKDATLPALVAVTVAYGKKQTTIDLEALRTNDGTTVSQLTFSVSARLAEADRAAVRKFGAKLAAALPPPEPIATDAPRVEPTTEPVIVPAPGPVVEVTSTPMREKRSSAPGWILGGSTVAAAATSAVFLGLATDARGRLESTPDPSPLTRPQAEQLAADANRGYTVALATGAAASALLVATIIWLASE